jgi:hypothetical protein
MKHQGKRAAVLVVNQTTANLALNVTVSREADYLCWCRAQKSGTQVFSSITSMTRKEPGRIALALRFLVLPGAQHPV